MQYFGVYFGVKLVDLAAVGCGIDVRPFDTVFLLLQPFQRLCICCAGERMGGPSCGRLAN